MATILSILPMLLIIFCLFTCFSLHSGGSFLSLYLCVPALLHNARFSRSIHLPNLRSVSSRHRQGLQNTGVSNSSTIAAGGFANPLFLKGAVDFVTDVASGVWNTVAGLLNDLVGGLWSIAQRVLSFVYDFFEPLFEALQETIGDIALGFLEGIVNLLALSVGSFLIVPNPVENPSIKSLFGSMVIVAIFFLVVGFFYQLITASIFPERETESLHSSIGRLMRAGVILVIIQPVLELAIAFSNLFTISMYPASYTLQFGANALINFAFSFGGVFGVLIIVGAVGTSIAMLVLFVFFLLAVRVVVIYTVYAISPVLVVGSAFKSGPLRYLGDASSVLFSMTAVLLFIGVVIGGMLQVGMVMSMWYTGAVGTDNADFEPGISTGGESQFSLGTGGGVSDRIIDYEEPDTDAPEFEVNSSGTSSSEVDGRTSSNSPDATEYMIGLVIQFAPLGATAGILSGIMVIYLLKILRPSGGGIIKKALRGGGVMAAAASAGEGGRSISQAAAQKAAQSNLGRTGSEFENPSPDEFSDTRPDDLQSGSKTEDSGRPGSPLHMKPIGAAGTFRTKAGDTASEAGERASDAGFAAVGGALKGAGERLSDFEVTEKISSSLSDLDDLFSGKGKAHRLQPGGPSKNKLQKLYTKGKHTGSWAGQRGKNFAKVNALAIAHPSTSETNHILADAALRSLSSEDVPHSDGPPGEGYGKDPTGQTNLYGQTARQRFGTPVTARRQAGLSPVSPRTSPQQDPDRTGPKPGTIPTSRTKGSLEGEYKSPLLNDEFDAPALEGYISRDTPNGYPDTPLGESLSERGIDYDLAVDAAESLAAGSDYSRDEILSRLETRVAAGEDPKKALNTVSEDVSEGELWDDHVNSAWTWSSSGVPNSADNDIPAERLDWDVDDVTTPSGEGQQAVFSPETEQIVSNINTGAPDKFQDGQVQRAYDQAVVSASQSGHDQVPNFKEFTATYEQKRSEGMGHEQALAVATETVVDREASPIRGEALPERAAESEFMLPTEDGKLSVSGAIKKQNLTATDKNPKTAPPGVQQQYIFADGHSVYVRYPHAYSHEHSEQAKLVHNYLDERGDSIESVQEIEDELDIDVLPDQQRGKDGSFTAIEETDNATRLDQLQEAPPDSTSETPNDSTSSPDTTHEAESRPAEDEGEETSHPAEDEGEETSRPAAEAAAIAGEGQGQKQEENEQNAERDVILDRESPLEDESQTDKISLDTETTYERENKTTDDQDKSPSSEESDLRSRNEHPEDSSKAYKRPGESQDKTRFSDLFAEDTTPEREGKTDIDGVEVDRESFVDTYAFSSVVGDDRISDSSVVVTEDGKVKRLYLEEVGQPVSESFESNVATIEEHADALGIDVSEEEVIDRMEEFGNKLSGNF
jgi:hypothetical protein